LDLYSLNFDDNLLQWAQQLQRKMDQLFWDDASNSGYFISRTDDPSIIARLQDEQDGAEPCATSVRQTAALDFRSFASNSSNNPFRWPSPT
jgi:uncharacterized protein YyaL (SSP411 family)